MKHNYLPQTQPLLMLLLWAGLLMPLLTGAQTIPDPQWARVGSTLAITNDGNIVTSETIFIPNNPGFPGQGGDRLVKYSLRGDQIWSTGLLKGGFYLGGKIPGFDYESIRQITASAASADGGVIVAGPLNLRGGANVAVKVDKDGVSGSWQDNETFGGIPSGIVTTPDGGFIILTSVAASQPNTPSTVVLRKYNSGKQLVWTKQIAYPGSTSPDVGLTKGNTIINTPDGGYLVAGYYNHAGADSPYGGWVAKLDGEGNVSWQKLISPAPLTNFPGPGDISSVSNITDAIISVDGTGYALTGSGVAYPNSSATVLVEIDGDGNTRAGRSKAIILGTNKAYLTIYTAGDGKKYYAFGSTSTQGRADPQILLVDPTRVTGVISRTFPGPGASSLIDIATAGDGSLVYVTNNNQLVKLQPEPTTPTIPIGGDLALTAPTYNCATGAITFNTSGGDGSPIEYMAPGITGWTTNPNHILDGCARTCADTPPFLISARQSGRLVTYTWSRQNHCTNPPPPPPPVDPPTPYWSYLR